jgi:thiol peroxidase
MAQVTLGGNPVNTSGDLPAPGSTAPSFTLTGADLSDISTADLSGKSVVLNIFPSIDTPTCATSVRTFNERAAGLDDTVVLCVSADLPFAQGRFCGAEGIANVKTASTFRSSFGSDYGVTLTDGKLAGVLARAVVVIGPDGTVKHTELVPEIAQEPNYDAALGALSHPPVLPGLREVHAGTACVNLTQIRSGRWWRGRRARPAGVSVDRRS